MDTVSAYVGALPVCLLCRALVRAYLIRTVRACPKDYRRAPSLAKHIVDANPMTSVGKILKPELRCHAAARLSAACLTRRFGSVPTTPGGRS